MTKLWTCYLVGSHQHTYVGVTLTPERRLRQHNGEIKGGAKYTRRHSDWQFLTTITGFANRSVVQKFETQMKRFRRRQGGGRGWLKAVQRMWILFKAHKLWEQGCEFHVHPALRAPFVNESERDEWLVRETAELYAQLSNPPAN